MALPHINKKHRTCDMMMAGNLMSWLQYVEERLQSQIIDQGQRLVIQDNVRVASRHIFSHPASICSEVGCLFRCRK